MEKFNLLATHLVIAITIRCVVLINAHELSLSSNQNSTTDVLPVINKSLITLDLTKCTCSSQHAPCDLTIIKSNVIDLDCLEGEHLCCPTVETPNMFKSDTNITRDPTDETNSTIIEPPKGNIRVYSINPTPYTLDYTQKVDLQKQKKNCQCKARSSCPHKYIDYGFGFHCSYSTVRCCIPDSGETNLNTSIPSIIVPSDDPTFNLDVNVSDQEDKSELSLTTQMESNVMELSVDYANMINETEPLSEPSDSEQSNLLNERSEGELTITEVTNSWNSGDYPKEPECFCLPVQKCQSSLRLETNNIERRRDTLCPGDLTQCCGVDVIEEITKKQDDTELARTNIKQVEYPPYQQPVQLPNSKLPMEDEDETQNDQTPITAIIPPPSLPTQYHSYEPSNHQAVNNYRPNTYPTQMSGPQEYRNGAYGQNIRPWVGLSSPSASYAKYPSGQNEHPGYPRGPYPDNASARSSKPSSGGFLDTLAQMLG